LISSKLTKILGTFTKGELKEFEKFIGSAYYNKGRNYVPLLKVLASFYPDFDNEQLSHEYIYSQLYPGKKFNRQILWNMFSSLQNMAEEYLINISLEKNRFVKNSLLADEFLNRKLAGYQAKKLDEMEKTLEKMGIDDKFFGYKNKLETERMSYHFLEDTQHLLSEHIVKKGEYAILSMLRELSAVINDLNANAFMFNAKFDVNIPKKFMESLDMEAVLKYSRENKFAYTDNLEMLYSSIMSVLEPDDERYFLRLKELFETNIDTFSANEKLSWVTTLSNYCTLKANKGETKYREYLFEINNLELKVGFSTGNKHLSKILFIQILRNALTINETEWSRKYIEEYSPKLKPSYRKPMRALALAYLYQKLKEYPKVLENLKDVKFIDARDKMYVKSIYIRTYYEMGETELLMYQVDSARHFISGAAGLSEITRTNFLRFLNYLTNLVNAIEKRDKLEIEMIESKLNNDPELPFGEWLLMKIAEINKGADK